MADSTKRKLRIAFIGAGGIAGTQMRCFKEMDDVEMVAIADISETALESRSTEYNIAECFADYESMLSKVSPDAVSVCTPNGLHAPAAIASLSAGAHVIVEKPLAMNAREGKAMLDAAGNHRRKLVIGFQQRFDPRAQFIRKAVDSGRLGRILFGRVQALRRRGIPNWGVFGRKELQGGGPLVDIGVHVLEAVHYIMGAPRPVAASGNVFTYVGDRQSETVCRWPDWDHKTYTVEDLAVGQVRFEDGAVIHVESSFAAHIQADVWNFQLMGDKGGATWDPLSIARDDNGYMVNTEPGWLPKSGFESTFGAKLRNFVDHVLYNKPTLAPAEHGLMVQKMMDAIYLSAEKGREVDIE